MSAFATVQDVMTLWRDLSADEIDKVSYLLDNVSDVIRFEGKKAGKDVDAEIENDNTFGAVVKLVTVAVVRRYFNESDESGQMSQITQSALGYSITGTYANAGGGIRLLRNELKQLGFKRQRIGVIDFCHL